VLGVPVSPLFSAYLNNSHNRQPSLDETHSALPFFFEA
jgi:hypothetical protein